MKKLLALALLLLPLAAAAGAQIHHGHSFRPSEKKFPLIPGMGELNHKVTTTNPTAQAYFNQGLTLVYGFNYDGAFASFREALAADPGLAMAQWGMALAKGANINIDIDAERMKEAAQHVALARTLSARATQQERNYIEALSTRYSPDPATADKMQLAADYSRAMAQLARKYPSDPDASTLYAESLMDLRPWRLWTRDGKPYEGTQAVVDVLKATIAAHPRHAGAVHYHLHALEPSPLWAQAAGDAALLQTLVPASGHLVHMPSHIFYLQGDYERASQSNLQAIKVDLDYKKNVADDGYVGHYLSHNMHFLAVARSMQGRFADALAAARQAEANVLEHVAEEPGLEHYLTTPTLVLARFEQWDGLLTAREPERARLIAHAMWTWGRAAGFAGKRDVARARAAQREFKREAAAAGCYLSWGNNPTGALLNVADLDLSARISAAAGDDYAAAQILKIAADAVKDLLYDEPPPWFIPPYEAMGRALLRAGRPAEAERAFREDLKLNRRNGRSLYGLAESLRAQRRSREAAAAGREFERAWKSADTRLDTGAL
ncbi:MAG TPA: hypothetical protein VF659_16840 [Pyrinomonadaceae bacterium]|jgi:tetratricopeptide (TPR) repeat protein